MASKTHAIVVDESPTSISMFSPQLPGFSFGRPTWSEFVADYQKALFKEGVRGEVEGHRQYFGVLGDGQEYAVRWSTDEAHREERVALAHQVIGILETDPQRVIGEDGYQPSPDGVVTFICTLPADRLDWILEQMDPRGEVMTVCAMVTDQMIFGTTIASHIDTLEWPSIEQIGWSAETTVGEMMTSLASGIAKRVLVAV